MATSPPSLQTESQRYLLPHITWNQRRWFTPLACPLWTFYSVLVRVHTSLWPSPGDNPA